MRSHIAIYSDNYIETITILFTVGKRCRYFCNFKADSTVVTYVLWGVDLRLLKHSRR
jgi:hypothetical protein